jgi:hypothetical protein
MQQTQQRADLQKDQEELWCDQMEVAKKRLGTKMEEVGEREYK